jgi:uncharacterized membrane protein YebE (DUF533 family)
LARKEKEVQKAALDSFTGGGNEMRLTLAMLLALFASTATMAQGPIPSGQAQAVGKARVKIWTGVVLVAAGAFVALPLATDSSNSHEAAMVGSLGMMGVGSGLVYWGFRQQQRAVQPSITFGVTVGRKAGVVVRRSW